jgi:hypothetical protein
MWCRASAVLFVLAVMTAFSTPALAQKGKGNAGPQATDVIIDATVEQVVPQGIVANDKSGKKYAIGFDGTSKIGLKGNAGIEFVTPGSFVQFDVDLDEKGMPTAEVKKIQITTQSPINEPGIFSSKGPDGKPGEAGTYFVRGTVRTNKDDTLTVSAGNKQMTVKVAAAITVPVTVADWRLAKPGDKLKGNGKAYVVPNAPMTPVLGTQIEITAAMPITKGKK